MSNDDYKEYMAGRLTHDNFPDKDEVRQGLLDSAQTQRRAIDAATSPISPATRLARALDDRGAARQRVQTYSDMLRRAVASLDAAEAALAQAMAAYREATSA